jgi:hypothetical protein
MKSRPKRPRTAAEERRDEQYEKVRRVLGLVAVYHEMLESHLAADAFDVELVKRMAAIRETVLLLIEAAMPISLAAGVEEITTRTRAVH